MPRPRAHDRPTAAERSPDTQLAALAPTHGNITKPLVRAPATAPRVFTAYTRPACVLVSTSQSSHGNGMPRSVTGTITRPKTDMKRANGAEGDALSPDVYWS